MDLARQHVDHHMQKFGLTKPNVEFIEGDIDQLEKTTLEENSIDVVVYVQLKIHKKTSGIDKSF